MPRNRNGTPSLTSRFAEILADSAGTDHDGSVPYVAKQLGLNIQQANDVMQNLRKRYGAQGR